MEKHRRRIITVLTILLCSIYLTILISINLFNYQSNVKLQRREIYKLIDNVGLETLCEYPKTDARLEDEEYYVVRTQKGKEPEMLVNYMDGYSEKKLIDYAKKIQKQKWVSGGYRSMVYVKKSVKSEKARLIVIMSNDFAMENSRSLILFSVTAFILGSLVLLAVAVLFSRWLVQPAERAIRASKEFMSSASHELKTPLTIISANTELLKEEFGDNQQLEYIRQETVKMNRLIGEMLTLVRLDADRLQSNSRDFDLSSAMLDVVLPFESLMFEHQLHFTFDIADGLRYCGEQDKLQRVMSVLLDNAVSYTPSGGDINVRVFLKNRQIYFVVSNTGAEIPKDMQKSIFERFYREAETSEFEERHFGLGLSIADSIVKSYRGKIFVESAGGVNTFTVSIPQGK